MDPFWKPENKIVITDSLCPAVAWRHKFKSEFAERCDGAVDRQWLDALAAMLYPMNSDRDRAGRPKWPLPLSNSNF